MSLLGDHMGLDLGGLICCIYDAALDASRWQEFLARFVVEFSSQSAAIFGHDFSERSAELAGESVSLAAHHGISGSAMHSFAAHYCGVNVWTQDEHLHHEGAVVNGSSLYPDRYLSRTEWYGDWLKPQDLFYSFAIVVEKKTQRTLNLTAMRSKRCGPYRQEDEARLRLLVPHLQTAFALHRRLHRAEALASASLAVLEGLPIGVVLLDEHASVLHANARAHQLAQATGLLRFGAGDQLRAASAGDELRLARAMRMAVTTGAGNPISAGDAIRMHGLDGSLLHVLVTPLPQWSSPFGQHAAGAVFISDPTSTAQSLAQTFCSFYRLTGAEARLAQAVVNGLTLQEYASRQEVSIHTVRSQFKSAAAKMGVTRQADFVRTVLTGPAMLRWVERQQG
ncbi:MAG: helix-turn-helix transcriptional regulator [Burkholderiaceae bacterium]|jgi:DNA-binding CsgD family transcriptional regulator|nr:helix-turn-helix transcriptional regulator [Burkholderiaceae bacterium]